MSELKSSRSNFPRAYEFKPKKSLGQNFLIDKNVVGKIIRYAGITEGKTVIEVGSGTGALTKMLLDVGAKVFAVEIDNRLYAVLEEKFGSNKNFSLKKCDILDVKLSDFNLKEKAILIGNLPFYISSQILAKFLPESDSIEAIYVTIQKELGERLVSPAGARDTGSLSLLAQFFSKPEILFTIKKTCFRPIPKVDASFVRFLLKDSQELGSTDQAKLFLIIRSAFKYRRKTIFNALANSFEAEALNTAFVNSGVDSHKRPEALTLGEYIKLAECLKNR